MSGEAMELRAVIEKAMAILSYQLGAGRLVGDDVEAIEDAMEILSSAALHPPALYEGDVEQALRFADDRVVSGTPIAKAINVLAAAYRSLAASRGDGGCLSEYSRKELSDSLVTTFNYIVGKERGTPNLPTEDEFLKAVSNLSIAVLHGWKGSYPDLPQPPMPKEGADA